MKIQYFSASLILDFCTKWKRPAPRLNAPNFQVGNIFLPVFPEFSLFMWVIQEVSKKYILFWTCNTNNNTRICKLILYNVNSAGNYMYHITQNKKKLRFFNMVYLSLVQFLYSRSQWPRGLRRRSAAACLLRSWVPIPPGGHGYLCVVCCQIEVSATSWSLVQRSPTDCGLRRRSTAARLLRSWVRIPPGEWMIVFCDCCVLSGRGLCDELITRPEESYRLWCVAVCDIETSRMRRPWPALGRSATG